MRNTTLEQEGWRLIEGHGAILEAARDVSRILRNGGVSGAIVGGVAVGLHGHVRATMDVDVFVARPETLAQALLGDGYVFDKRKREFRRDLVPVHLVTPREAGVDAVETIEINGIVTADLADLIGMKLRSGLRWVTRAQDLADVIALIRVRRLGLPFASRLDRPLRNDFRRLVRAVRREG
jgi:hypothetical protein